MKKTTTILSIISVLGISNLYAQEECKVLVTEIAGKYEGECKKGKAEGQGTATGTDEYTGSFKGGYPEGKGVYTWKNGNVYDGMWAKGKREGEGRMVIKREGKADSVVTGFWKRNEYAGKFAKPFTIHNRTNHIAKVEVRKGKESSRTIMIEVASTSGGIPNMNGSASPKIDITEIILAKGNYTQVQHVSSTTKGSIKKLMDVTFPFRARIRFGTQEVDLEIQEEGNWNAIIGLNQ